MATEPLPAACLAGPTGCGKTRLAVELALLCGCEIINADSRQLYADFPIITAQPVEEERKGVPHHLYGMLASREKLDAAAWAALAAEKAGEIRKRGKIPLFVGGSGFYLAALFDGLSDIPAVPGQISQAVMTEMARLGPSNLHARLARCDPQTASKIHPRDRQRIMRGLEVWEATGKPLTWWQQRPRRPLCSGPMFFMDIGLSELTPFLGARIEKMLARGAVAEAQLAFSRCADLSAAGWSGIGCAHALQLGRPGTEKEKILAEWLSATRKYAKRQLTWFRNKKGFITMRKPPSPNQIEKIISLSPNLGSRL